MKLLTTIFILATLATVSCGEGPIMVEVFDAPTKHDLYGDTNLDQPTTIIVDALMRKVTCMVGYYLPHKVRYDPNDTKCHGRVIASATQVELNGIHMYNVINFCENPNDMDYYHLEQTLLHEMGHSVMNIHGHYDDRLDLMNSTRPEGDKWDMYLAHRVELIARTYEVSTLHADKCLNN